MESLLTEHFKLLELEFMVPGSQMRSPFCSMASSA
jgi:hypothetical protein